MPEIKMTVKYGIREEWIAGKWVKIYWWRRLWQASKWVLWL